MEKETTEYFPKIKKIQYQPNSKTNDVLTFKHYNEEEVVMGKKMHEWLRFAVCYWHSFVWQGNDIFGNQTFNRPWNNKDLTPMEQAECRLNAAFEFFEKVGVKYYTFHDRDMAPEGNSLEETNSNLDKISDLALKLQQKTGVKLLWGTSNLFSHPRYMNGASTNPDVNCFLYAAAQVKKMMEITKKLGGENFVFWGGREGYQSLLNTDVKTEQDHMGKFFQLAAAFKKKINLEAQLLIEPKAKEPTKHQYDYDAQTVIGFLKNYGLEKDFKLNIEPNHSMLAGHPFEHDLEMSSAAGLLGSIDMNTGEPSLGWDTDNFLMEPKQATLVMLLVLKQGGLGSGGLNFDCKVRRESTDLEDMFIAHVAAMDLLAYGLKTAAKIIADGEIEQMKKERYLSFGSSDLWKKLESGEAGFEDCEKFVLGTLDKKVNQGEVVLVNSGKQEKFERVFNNYFI